ncbi:lipoprotein, partial [Brucella abortus]
MKSRRMFRHRGSVAILLTAFLAGCGTTTPLDTFNLSTPQPMVTVP